MKTIFTRLVSLVAISSVALSAYGETTTSTSTADLFDLETGKKIYTYKSVRTTIDGKTVVETSYNMLDGTPAAVEKAEIAADNRIVRYDVELPQAKEKGVITTDEKNVYFKHKVKRKKESKGKGTYTSSTLVSSNMVDYIKQNFSKLVAKDSIDFGFAVWHRKEVVNFRMAFEKEEGDTLTAKMYPTNLLYRSLVNPMYYVFNKKTKQLVERRGRVLPKVKKGRSWKSLDARVVYKYEN